jgi:hypothetical protein
MKHATVMRSAVGLAAAAMVAGCEGSTLGPQDGMAFTARASVGSLTQAPVVLVSVTVRNRTDLPVSITTTGGCPVSLILETDDGALVYDDGTRICTSDMEVIEIDPGAQHTWLHSVSVESLMSAGVEPGDYIAKARVAAAPTPLIVLVGNIIIPRLAE